MALVKNCCQESVNVRVITNPMGKSIISVFALVLAVAIIYIYHFVIQASNFPFHYRLPLVMVLSVAWLTPISLLHMFIRPRFNFTYLICTWGGAEVPGQLNLATGASIPWWLRW
jgi:hypothetical protein